MFTPVASFTVPVTVPSLVVSGQVWPLPMLGPLVLNLSFVLKQQFAQSQLMQGRVVVVVAPAVSSLFASAAKLSIFVSIVPWSTLVLQSPIVAAFPQDVPNLLLA